MTALYLIAEIHPKQDQLQALAPEFSKLIDKTRAEKGCIFYDLVQEEGSKGWLMVEKWESRLDWENHDKSEHVRHMQSLGHLFEKDTNLRFMTEVEL